MQELDVNKFNELKDLTEKAYKNIGSVPCPALKTQVFFNSDGFHHLRYNNQRSERSKIVQFYKFKFLSKVVEIIKISTTIQEYRRGFSAIGKPDKNGFRKTALVQWFGFFAVTNFSQPTRIMVVVRKIGENGQYHFWSVMPYWSLSNKNRIVGKKVIEDQ